MLHGKAQVLTRNGGFKGQKQSKANIANKKDIPQEESAVSTEEFSKKDIERLKGLLNSLAKTSSTCSLAQKGFSFPISLASNIFHSQSWVIIWFYQSYDSLPK